MGESYQATREHTEQRLAKSMEEQFGLGPDEARRAAKIRAAKAMDGVLTEHKKVGRNRPIEIK